MRAISLLWAALAAISVVTLAGCGGSGNPGPAANIQACKDFATYEQAVTSGAVLQSEAVNGSAGPVAHRLVTFLVSSSGKPNTEISQSLRHDLAKLLVDASLGTTPQGYMTDDVKATMDCAAVKATNGAKV